MNNLIELGRKTFEFAGVGNVGFNKDGSLYHKDTRKAIVDKRGRLIKTGRGSLSRTDRTAVGAGAGALAGAGAAVGGSALIAKRRQAEKAKIQKRYVGLKPAVKKLGNNGGKTIDKRTKAYKDSLKGGKKAPTPAYKARAEMRKKYGQNWYRPGGSKKKLLGYGALAGAALGGVAGRYARKKKGDS
tara:strand:- start:81 stop:638 length:558 start_codon:yes stop_codon:yes gene_type:complete